MATSENNTTQFKDAVDIKSFRLDEVITALIDAHGIVDVISVLQSEAFNLGYGDAAVWLRTAYEQIEAESDESYGEVRQTGCKHCGLDIEGFRPFPKGEWRDRGNNTHCNDAKHSHAPIVEVN